MDILIVAPFSRDTRRGNGVTSRRWREVLRELGHDVQIKTTFEDGNPEVLVALHARRSADSIQQFSQTRSDRPIVLGLAGTDLYRDYPDGNEKVRESLDRADRYVVLQSAARERLPDSLRDRVHVIYQSVRDVPEGSSPGNDTFQVSVLGHLRPVKDPFRTAKAVRSLPDRSTIQVVHAGAALNDEMKERAEEENRENPRYRWIGEKPRKEALRLLSSSNLMVLSSEMEGGANVLSEAIACETPVLSSRIDGSVGMLGDGYPGYFEVGNTNELSDLLQRAEEDRGFYRRLLEGVRAKKELVKPERERRSWRRVIERISAGTPD